MPYNPYTTINTYNYYRESQNNSFIRVMHASPNAPAVDIYSNGKLIIQSLGYKQFTQYIPTPPGDYNIRIYPAGQTTNPVIDTTVVIPQNTVFNLTVIGKYPSIEIYTVPEPITAQSFGRACIRFIHLSPDASTVDITLQNGTKVFSGLGFKDITDYACIPSGTYSFQIKLSGTNGGVLTLQNLQLLPNNYYTVYIVGFVEQAPPVEVIPVLEPR